MTRRRSVRPAAWLLIVVATSTNSAALEVLVEKPLSYDGVLGGAMPAGHLRVAGTVHSFPSDIRVMPFAQATPFSSQRGGFTLQAQATC